MGGEAVSVQVSHRAVMAGLDPAIHGASVDTRVKPAHNALFGLTPAFLETPFAKAPQDEGFGGAACFPVIARSAATKQSRTGCEFAPSLKPSCAGLTRISTPLGVSRMAGSSPAMTAKWGAEL